MLIDALDICRDSVGADLPFRIEAVDQTSTD